MNRRKHKVMIQIADKYGAPQEVVTGTTMKLPERILRFLFGELTELMLITPGGSVVGIEVRELGGPDDEAV